MRIGLNPEELQQHPLRLGLSMIARIDTGRPGRSQPVDYPQIPWTTLWISMGMNRAAPDGSEL
ncbi:hypothetical protein [Methylocaldum sp.]|uniref:hypothetical protein n=1 Tax=Methylocaldum sp. TaxID=1969727 RepID=UPI002D286C5F|nr:hypothetical protein [Methylocaldum sp.]HYE36585.1 hypothetical protein [Methylocaldum sp.]